MNCEAPFRVGSIVVSKIKCDKQLNHKGRHRAMDEKGLPIRWSEVEEPIRYAAIACPPCSRSRGECPGHPASEAVSLNGSAYMREADKVAAALELLSRTGSATDLVALRRVLSG